MSDTIDLQMVEQMRESQKSGKKETIYAQVGIL